MNAEQRLAYLLESVWVPTNRGVVLRDVYAAAGDAEGLVALTLRRVKNPILSDEMSDNARNQAEVLAEQVSQACIAMSTKDGLVLSDEKSQLLIDILAHLGQWPNSARDAVKALGGVWHPRWQVEGYASEPTLESVSLELQKQQLADAAADAYQAFREALSAWNGSGDAPVLGGS
jgi:hypothetical protein